MRGRFGVVATTIEAATDKRQDFMWCLLTMRGAVSAGW
jgi:hypothetical protein